MDQPSRFGFKPGHAAKLDGRLRWTNEKPAKQDIAERFSSSKVHTMDMLLALSELP